MQLLNWRSGWLAMFFSCFWLAPSSGQKCILAAGILPFSLQNVSVPKEIIVIIVLFSLKTTVCLLFNVNVDSSNVSAVIN